MRATIFLKFFYCVSAAALWNTTKTISISIANSATWNAAAKTCCITAMPDVSAEKQASIGGAAWRLLLFWTERPDPSWDEHELRELITLVMRTVRFDAQADRDDAVKARQGLIADLPPALKVCPSRAHRHPPGLWLEKDRCVWLAKGFYSRRKPLTVERVAPRILKAIWNAAPQNATVFKNSSRNMFHKESAKAAWRFYQNFIDSKFLRRSVWKTGKRIFFYVRETHHLTRLFGFKLFRFFNERMTGEAISRKH